MEEITNLTKIDNPIGMYMFSWFTMIIIVIVAIYFVYLINLTDKQCNKLSSLYPTINNKMVSVVPGNNLLKDYHIKTAYNCCSLGSYMNDFVGMCALDRVLQQGVRCLDFEIFSVNDEPVVSTSMSENFYVKETYNSIKFSDIVQKIKTNAFKASFVPNPKDPLILHLRFKTNNAVMYDNLATILSQYNSMFISNKYNVKENISKNTNLGNIQLSEMMGKIVIIADNSNPAFNNSSDFCEYVNIISNSPDMRLLDFYQVQYNDQTELTQFNTSHMTMVVPVQGVNPENPDVTLLQKTGCNMFGMRYQYDDAYLDLCNTFFDNAGSAFVLKNNITK
jgi:hypothetical protein